jgi:signal transduction histidine kinase
VQLEFLDDADARESLRSDVVGDGSHGGDPVGIGPTEAHRRRIEPEGSRHLGDLIRSLVSEFKDRLPDVVLGTLVDEPVSVDPEKIRIVLRNLLDNALKHTLKTGRRFRFQRL